MRKGTYKSNPNKPVVVTIEVKSDMADEDFQYELERAMALELRGAVILSVHNQED